MLNDGRIILRALVVLIGYMVAAGLVGAVACFLFGSSALSYAIWFVLGIFTGFIVFGAAGEWAAPAGKGEWIARPGAARAGNFIVAASLAALVGLGLILDSLLWGELDGEYFVPASAPHTITFFVSIFLAMLIGRHIMVEERTW